MAPEGGSNNAANAQKQPAAGSGGSAAAAGGSHGNGNGEAGIPFYEAQRKNLAKLMEKRRKVAERLVRLHLLPCTHHDGNLPISPAPKQD